MHVRDHVTSLMASGLMIDCPCIGTVCGPKLSTAEQPHSESMQYLVSVHFPCRLLCVMNVQLKDLSNLFAGLLLKVA